MNDCTDERNAGENFQVLRAIQLLSSSASRTGASFHELKFASPPTCPVSPICSLTFAPGGNADLTTVEITVARAIMYREIGNQPELADFVCLECWLLDEPSVPRQPELLH